MSRECDRQARIGAWPEHRRSARLRHRHAITLLHMVVYIFGMGILLAVGLNMLVNSMRWKQEKLGHYGAHYSWYRLVAALRDDAHRAQSVTAADRQILFQSVHTSNKMVKITYQTIPRGVERIEQQVDQQTPSRREVFSLPVENVSAVRHGEGLLRVEFASRAASWSVWLRLGRDRRWGVQQMQSAP